MASGGTETALEAVHAHGGACSAPAHMLSKKTFMKPTYCTVCEKLLAGVYHQGVCCETCHITCHAKCRGGLVTPCLGSTFSGANPFPHRLRDTHYGSPTYCVVCRYLIKGVGNQGLGCPGCAVAVHHDCASGLARLYPFCRPTATAESGAGVTRHHWIEANGAGPCGVCEGSTRSVTCLSGFECSQCLKRVHTRCMPSVDHSHCDGGALAPLRVAPHLVSVDETGAASIDADPEHPDGPLCVLVNPGSGGQQGVALMAAFSRLLSPHQVFNLKEGGPEAAFAAMGHLPAWRILGCGGDGTIGWILSALDGWRESHDVVPHVAVLPLGTGNDLSRALGWGPGYTSSQDLGEILRRVAAAKETHLDRWQIAGAENCVLNNYWSIGVDAKIALKFHLAREAHPERFTSRSSNKLFYARAGAAETFDGCPQLHQEVTLACDGEPVELPADTQGIIVLNLPSYGGGSDLWGDGASYNDGLLEVVAVSSAVHLGRIKSGLGSANRIAQCRAVEVAWSVAYPVQVDGEPSMAEPGSITIEPFGEPVGMLCPQATDVLAHTPLLQTPSDDDNDDDGDTASGDADSLGVDG